MPEPGKGARRSIMNRILSACLKLLLATISLVLVIEYLKTIWPYLVAIAVIALIVSVVWWWIRRRNTW